MIAEERERLARDVLRRSNADQTEVLLNTSDGSLTRFSHGISNQNVACLDRLISVRAIVDGRTGVAKTNRFDDASLTDVVDSAIEMARLAPKDPMQPKLPSDNAPAAPAGAYVAATAAADAPRRAEMVDAVFKQAEGASYWCAGYASTSSAGITVANSSGVLASFDGTDAAINVKMVAEDSTGFSEALSADVGAIDAAALGRRAVEKARAGARPRAIEPGEWSVILEPAAFGELFHYVSSHF